MVNFFSKKTNAQLLGRNGGSGPSSDCDKNDPKHCVGYEACAGADLDDVKDKDTCNGYRACFNLLDSSVDRNSGYYNNACFGSEEMKIGKNSCTNQERACANASSNVIGDDDACSSNRACEYAANNHVGDFSCVTEYACQNTEGNKIRRNACSSYHSC